MMNKKTQRIIVIIVAAALLLSVMLPLLSMFAQASVTQGDIALRSKWSWSRGRFC